ncbi:uroplakin-1a-like [Lynx pardinus]|uniref:Uroplakin-1a-like n=1 Tax=Lynx pardinus TaxID=191816 RepID=A0A485P9U1_LYNPA|nr:uroplakin-1a-like [Lynx pardinus]
MASAAAEAEKGSPVVVGLLVVGNIIILLSGLALFAETVWVTADQYRVYPLMGVSGKDDVFAGAWIAIFCGFSFFVVASFGVGAALCRRRSMILTYLVLMLIVYIFECASCITSYTHRDYPRLRSGVMERGACANHHRCQSHPAVSQARLCAECVCVCVCARVCVRVVPWNPHKCSRRPGSTHLCGAWAPHRIPGSPEPLWEVDTATPPIAQGCFEHISHAIDSYTWGISWFGFAILMWTLPVMLMAMYFYTTL